MCKVKDALIDCEALQDKVDFLKEHIQEQRETIARLENEKRFFKMKVQRKDIVIKGLKLNNSKLTIERNNALDELASIKRMSMYEFAKYQTSEEQEKAGRVFARELLGR